MYSAIMHLIMAALIIAMIVLFASGPTDFMDPQKMTIIAWVVAGVTGLMVPYWFLVTRRLRNAKKHLGF